MIANLIINLVTKAQGSKPIMPMNSEIKKEWVALLRSGKWIQARKALCEGDRRCCLGVLCELAVEKGVISSPVPLYLEPGRLAFEGCIFTLPYRVSVWAGLDSADPEVGAPIRSASGDLELSWLSRLNDRGKTFPEIADLIEEYL